MKKLASLLLLTTLFTLAAQAQVEVKYFHGKQRCATCLCIERYAKEVVTQQYKGNKVKFVEIDISTPKGKKEAEKYKVTWSALLLVKGQSSSDQTSMAFQYARKQPEEFKRLLKVEIDKMTK